MDVSLRTMQLNQVFSFDKKVELKESHIDIIPFRFEQKIDGTGIENIRKELSNPDFYEKSDDDINENKFFDYLVFTPNGKEKRSEAIFLMHGLNERSWKKYLPWAEYLAKTTGKAIILFPIAFHMNRTPSFWTNPRAILPWVDKRKQEITNLQNSTFVNLALSSRLSQNPLRFYTSGRETCYNIRELAMDIKNGKHPLFKEDTSINVFAYSIGALLSQVLFPANPDNLFSDSKLFIFCGGSIFCEMNGNARDIMDSNANDTIHQYFMNDFLVEQPESESFNDNALKKAFKAMIRSDVLKDYREAFFRKSEKRIKIISLKKDVVMPTSGVVSALGESAENILEEMDFPYEYTHQWPFPLNTKTDKEIINQSFEKVFNRAAGFL